MKTLDKRMEKLDGDYAIKLTDDKKHILNIEYKNPFNNLGNYIDAVIKDDGTRIMCYGGFGNGAYIIYFPKTIYLDMIDPDDFENIKWNVENGIAEDWFKENFVREVKKYLLKYDKEKQDKALKILKNQYNLTRDRHYLILDKLSDLLGDDDLCINKFGYVTRHGFITFMAIIKMAQKIFKQEKENIIK